MAIRRDIVLEFIACIRPSIWNVNNRELEVKVSELEMHGAIHHDPESFAAPNLGEWWVDSGLWERLGPGIQSLFFDARPVTA